MEKQRLVVEHFLEMGQNPRRSVAYRAIPPPGGRECPLPRCGRGYCGPWRGQSLPRTASSNGTERESTTAWEISAPSRSRPIGGRTPWRVRRRRPSPGPVREGARRGKGLFQQGLPDASGGLHHLLSPGLPEPFHPGDHVHHAGPARRPPLGQVGGGEEGQPFGSEKYVQGPSPAAVHHLADRHEVPVDVGTLFPVHLHRNAGVVQEVRHLAVAEGFPLHHVAPVAGGVAYGDEEGLVLLPGLPEGIVAPGVPVHRVVGMLQQVGRLLPGEQVSVPCHDTAPSHRGSSSSMDPSLSTLQPRKGPPGGNSR